MESWYVNALTWYVLVETFKFKKHYSELIPSKQKVKLRLFGSKYELNITILVSNERDRINFKPQASELGTLGALLLACRSPTYHF